LKSIFYILINYFRQEIRLSPDGSPTLECLRECDRLRDRCLSVVMSTDGPHSSSVAGGDFNRYGNWSSSSSGNSPPRLRCYILDRAATMDSASLPYTPNSIYFEKTCLPGRIIINCLSMKNSILMLGSQRRLAVNPGALYAYMAMN